MSGSPPTTNEDALTPAVLLWAGLGTVIQIGLVVAGHYSDAVYALWPVPSLATSVVTSIAYAIHIRRSFVDSAWHGAMVGGLCTFVGTALAAVLADTPALQIATVTLAAIAAGAVVGWLTFAVLRFVSPVRAG
jgi:hypothetical protein